MKTHSRINSWGFVCISKLNSAKANIWILLWEHLYYQISTRVSAIVLSLSRADWSWSEQKLGTAPARRAGEQSSWFLEEKRRRKHKWIIATWYKPCFPTCTQGKTMVPLEFCLPEQTYSIFFQYSLRTWTTQPSAPWIKQWITTFTALWEISVKQWRSLHVTSLWLYTLIFCK